MTEQWLGFTFHPVVHSINIVTLADTQKDAYLQTTPHKKRGQMVQTINLQDDKLIIYDKLCSLFKEFGMNEKETGDAVCAFGRMVQAKVAILQHQQEHQ